MTEAVNENLVTAMPKAFCGVAYRTRSGCCGAAKSGFTIDGGT